MLRITIFGLIMLTLAGCSTTPGDAALRGGHTPQAIELYESGANRGDPLAAKKLADIYAGRYGVPEDYEKAVHWYKKAIELGNIPSNWSVGVIYRDGLGNVPKDFGQAEMYFLQGAEKGQHYSMYDLASMYAEKQTKTANDVEGLKWLNIVTAFAATCQSTNKGCQYIMNDPTPHEPDEHPPSPLPDPNRHPDVIPVDPPRERPDCRPVIPPGDLPPDQTVRAASLNLTGRYRFAR